MKWSVISISLFMIILNVDIISSHFCGINLLRKPKRVLITQENDNIRHLKEENWESLRIHLDFSMIENNIGKFNKQDLIDLKEKIMPKTKQVFENLLKVKRVAGKLKLPATECDAVKVPEFYQEEGIDADIVIFVTIDDTGFFAQNHIEAAAIHCFQHDVTRRPIAGYIQFKSDLKVMDNKTALDYMVWLTIHEVTHILVMNDSLYEDWIDQDMKPLGINNVIGSRMVPSGRKMTYLKTPKILEKGREHFGCKTFEGLPLEYNGGPGTAGAHWSKRAMNSDYMIGDSYGENLISDLSLAMFEDSGWYKTDYSMSNLFLWGKNRGCDFLQQSHKCVDKKNNKLVTPFPSEFCTNLNYPVCSPHNIFRASCRTRKYKTLMPYEQYFGDANSAGVDMLTDKCPIPIEVKEGQVYYGGSCRVGQTKVINKFEKVCPECSCFMSNLRENAVDRKDNLDESNRENIKENVIEAKPNRKLRFKQLALVAELIPDFRVFVNNDDSNSTKLNTQINSTNVNNSTNIINVTVSNVTIDTNDKFLDSNPVLFTNNFTDDFENNNFTLTNATRSDSNSDKEFFENSLSNSLKKIALKRDPMAQLKQDDFRTYCFEYKCEDGSLFVKVLDKAYKCIEDKPITIEGFTGIIQCPPTSVLCHDKYKCKFGCTEKYTNANPN